MAIGGYIVTRDYLVVARNITLEEVSCKVNEYFVSEKTLYRCVYDFNKDIKCQLLRQTIWETIFYCNKIKHSITREHFVNND